MYKIFFKDRVVFLTDNIETHLTPDFGAIHKLGSDGELKKFIQNFETNTKQQEAIIYHHNKYELFRRFRACFKNLLAAGGLVWNKDEDHFLTIIRRSRPDLPKGKVEPGESFEEAAVREVAEECGIENTEITGQLDATFHTYHLNNQHILKETQWFEMIYNGNKTPKPQQEEEITQVKWMPSIEAHAFALNTYPSIVEIIKAAKLI
jgi:8-oxo-dGTP pyrophosphatase MutT (NUDIX family)